MTIRMTRALGVFLRLSVLSVSLALVYGQTQNGEWTLSRSAVPGKIHFSMQSARDGGHSFSTSSDWNVSELQGLDLTSPGKHDVHFTIARDAGNVEGEGFVRDDEGAGLFTFRANPQYSREMEALGFPGITDEKQMAFALHDVSLAYAREMKGLNLQGLDTNKLLACRIFHVDAAFVKELRAVGVNVPEAGKLIAFRIHRITPEYVEKLRAHGMQNLTADQLVRLRIYGIE